MPHPDLDALATALDERARADGMSGVVWIDADGTPVFAQAYGLADRAHVPVHVLSGGQKQLLALTSVLAVEPSVLICDEPTTLLDLRWTAHVDALLAGLPQQVVHVTHDLAAAATADRLLVVEDGHVVHDGDPAAGIAAYRERMLASAHAMAVGRTGAAANDVDGRVDGRGTTVAGPA